MPIRNQNKMKLSQSEKTKNFFNKYYVVENGVRGIREDYVDNFFRKNYNSFEAQEFIAEEIINDTSVRRILELGCGKGINISYLLKMGFQGNIFGIDISSVAINHARKKVELKNVNLSVQNATKLNFPNEFFDCVYVINLLHHVEDHLKVINEAKRVLRKNGKLLIVDLNGSNIFYKLAIKILPIFPKKLKNFLFEGDLFLDGEFPQRSAISSRQLKSLLEKNFIIVYEDYYHLFFNYFYYLYKAMLYYSGRFFFLIFKILSILNFFLIRAENISRKIFKYSCDMYVFSCIKK